MVVTRAREIKADVVVTAPTGNAGAALAACPPVGEGDHLRAQVCSAGEGSAIVFWRKVILVDGTYDER